MKIFISLLSLFIFCSCSENNFNKDTLSFELRLADAQYQSNHRQINLYNSDQKFFVSDSIYLNNSDIASAEILDWESQPKVKVVLKSEGRQKFAVFTKKFIGKNAAIIIDDKLLSAPRINAEINSGELIIIGFFNHEEALRIADGIVPDN